MGVMRSEAHGDLHRPNAGCISTLHCSCNCSCILKSKIEDENVHCTLLRENDRAHVGEAQNHCKKGSMFDFGLLSEVLRMGGAGGYVRL